VSNLPSLMRIRMTQSFLNDVIPLVEAGVGQSIDRAWVALSELDASSALAAPLWEWDPNTQSYIYTPIHLPRSHQYRQVMLSWAPVYGWVVSVPDPKVCVWVPLFSPEDPRNRPDKVILAATLTAQNANGDWTAFRKLLMEESREALLKTSSS
jgi:hypothetical protein